ncbi:MAG: CHAT domain-containing protein [Actinobacteria bacterium]|nr:CHAT domain-containing protein [Actinomycetota bacterium]
MKRSKKATIRLVLNAWRDRGWRDQEDAALAVVERLAERRRYDQSLVDAVPRGFLDRNGTTRDDVKDELSRVLGEIEIDESSAVAVEPNRLKIVFFAANPRDQVQLRLDEEAREVEQRLRATDHRDVIDFATRWAVRPADLIEALNQERPQIIHFSGHGSQTEALAFQDDFGGTKIVTKEALAGMIHTFSDEVRLVLFNNCFSEAHAQEAVKHIEAAIGMNDSISDNAARIFAANFYAALGYGRSVQNGFEQAKAALMLESIPEERTPQLFTRSNMDPSILVLVEAE